jgi:gas vesicle protein GvpO
VRQARRELANLIGGEPESVSGLERANGNWTVTLEVVELRRVPESTDVLSSYEVVVDDERKLVSARRLRRYRRSQVEEM